MNLTREQIEQSTDRELDWLVASNLLGWTSRVIQTETCFPEFDVTATPPDWDATRYHRVPNYSTTGEGMLLVLDRARELGFRIETSLWHKSACASVYRLADEPFGEWLWTTSAASLPEVTSRAALLAILAQETA